MNATGRRGAIVIPSPQEMRPIWTWLHGWLSVKLVNGSGLQTLETSRYPVRLNLRVTNDALTIWIDTQPIAHHTWFATKPRIRLRQKLSSDVTARWQLSYGLETGRYSHAFLRSSVTFYRRNYQNLRPSLSKPTSVEPAHLLRTANKNNTQHVC